MKNFLYRPVGIVLSALGGALASFLFNRLWQTVTGDEEAPKATDRDRSWRSVLTGAALHGAVYGAVKAAADRGGAAGFSAVTGAWPGED